MIEEGLMTISVRAAAKYIERQLDTKPTRDESLSLLSDYATACADGRLTFTFKNGSSFKG